MRILHLVHQYPPEYIGGTELYTQSLAHAQVSRQHTVGVFYRHNSSRPGLERRVDGDVRVWAAASGPLNPARRFLATFGDALIERSFEQALDEARPDLVHVQHLMGLPAALLNSLQRRRIPIVITLHDYWWVCANAQLVTGYQRRVCPGPRFWLNCARCALARAKMDAFLPGTGVLAPLLATRALILRRAALKAARFIAPTAFVQGWYAGHGIPETRIALLPHGIERPSRSPQRRTPNGTLRLAFVGGLVPQKGAHVLVNAFNELSGNRELWIAGDEDFDPGYVQHLRTQAGPGVKFLGVLAHDKVWDCLAQVDVVVVPSLWYESFSLITHEAFAAGLPVVASRLGALAAVVRHQVDGELVPPGDTRAWQTTLQRLVDDRAYLTHLAAGVQQPLGIDDHAAHLEALYAEAIQGG